MVLTGSVLADPAFKSSRLSLCSISSGGCKLRERGRCGLDLSGNGGEGVALNLGFSTDVAGNDFGFAEVGGGEATALGGSGLGWRLSLNWTAAVNLGVVPPKDVGRRPTSPMALAALPSGSWASIDSGLAGFGLGWVGGLDGWEST